MLRTKFKYTERKKFKSMSLKRLRIEQLCPSIDSISLCFCTLRHYVIVNLNVNENHVQYVHPCGSHSTQFESVLIVSSKTEKKNL